MGKFPGVTRAEMDLDCTDEEWSEFMEKVKAIGERDIELMLERQKQGQPEPQPVAQANPGLLYYWHHLMGEGDN